MGAFVLDLREVRASDVDRVGGKAANLGDLTRIDGVHVPGGFCVLTDAYQLVIRSSRIIGPLLDAAAALRWEDRAAIPALAGELRARIEGAELPDELCGAIRACLDGPSAYAVRSSATGEDAPTASFAGQHDTYLDVVGEEAILVHLRRCWASLFTERAMTYRLQQGVDPRRAAMAVVVQRMLRPEVSGVLFTADPLSGDRTPTRIEAVAGLGEGFVAGRVDADRYGVRAGKVVERSLATGERASPAPTTEPDIEAVRPDMFVLSDDDVGRLAALGRTIEAHFGQPQDVEWCLEGGRLHVVQSRPITTLYPIPAGGQPGNRVYLSVGHQQMMTDAMKPLGLSLFQLTAGRPMYPAGGRLFVDVTRELSSPATRDPFLQAFGRSDPLIEDALRTVLSRGDFLGAPTEVQGAATPVPAWAGPPPELAEDPTIVPALIARSEAGIEALRRGIRGRVGAELLDFILEDVKDLTRTLADPGSMNVILAGMGAASWLNAQMAAWLGERSAADTLAQSAPNNTTSEMGLALLDVADSIRPFPAVLDHLRRATDEDLLDGLLPLVGGPEARHALGAWLDRYGTRCVGEIDVTRPRWSEAPTALVPLILGNIRNFEPGEAGRRFAAGERAAADKEQGLLERLSRLPDGEEKVRETRRMIRRLRLFVGYREYPKSAIVRRFAIYRAALLEEAGRLLGDGVFRAREDIYLLTLPELREVVAARRVDAALVQARRDEHERHRRLRPPRVILSDGVVVEGAYRRSGLPLGALAGHPVSAGVAEGRARVLRALTDASLEVGDILVTPFTDPSWTPAFLTIRALVTEVGGLMTHGAVIAREYGLPAVVGVRDATTRIQDGQLIRVDANAGLVEILG